MKDQREHRGRMLKRKWIHNINYNNPYQNAPIVQVWPSELYMDPGFYFLFGQVLDLINLPLCRAHQHEFINWQHIKFWVTVKSNDFEKF